jgi:hypothetical protein
VDTSSVKRWCEGAKRYASLAAVRRVLQVFRAACHHGDPANDSDEDSSLRIASDAAFQHILIFTLTEMDSCFRRLLSLKSAPTPVPESTFSSPKCAQQLLERAALPACGAQPAVTRAGACAGGARLGLW